MARRSHGPETPHGRGRRSRENPRALSVLTVMDADLVVAKDDPARAGVWRLRYAVYVQERKWAPPEADHVGRRVRDPLDSHAIVLAAVDRETQAVVGTARTNLLIDGTVPVYTSLYRLTDLSAVTSEHVSVTTYVAVAAPHRRTGIGADLACALYDLRMARGVKFDYLDCPSDLVPHFTRLGYRWLRALRHPWFGQTQLMRLSLTDTEFLTSVHSPLLRPRRRVVV